MEDSLKWKSGSLERQIAPGVFLILVCFLTACGGGTVGGANTAAPNLGPTQGGTSVGVAPPPAAPSVYVIDSLRKVGAQDPVPASVARSASVFAAKNEYEGFQIVVNGGQSGCTGVNAELTASLVGPQGVTIPSGMITFYREHYVNITAPSNSGAGGAKPGSYPDALIPFRNPFTGEPIRGGTYPSAPFDVLAGQNQPIYVEIYVPATVPAGVYSGTITVSREEGTKLADVPVSLTVWDFALPKAPSFRSAFHDYDSDHLIGPASYYRYTAATPEHLSLARAMDENLIAHRLMPESPMYAQFTVDSTGHIIANPGADSAIESLLARPEYSDFALPFSDHFPFARPLDLDRTKTIAYLRDAYQWLSNRGFLDKIWLRTQDEPQTAADFQRVRDFADLIHEANPNYRVAITADFAQREVETYLYGHINTLVMGSWSFDPVASAQRQAAGDQVWSYTGLVVNEQNPSPFWQIDFPLMNYRIVPWISYRYGLRGLLYWTTANWGQLSARGRSPWTDPCNHREAGECFNGEGMLVYPGKEVNYVIPQNAYGPASPAAVYGPIPTLRLKALRDGMQDYELLALATRRDPVIALQAAVQVGCAGNPNPGNATSNCFHSWNHDPDVLLRVRAQLAALITGSR